MFTLLFFFLLFFSRLVLLSLLSTKQCLKRKKKGAFGEFPLKEVKRFFFFVKTRGKCRSFVNSLFSPPPLFFFSSVLKFVFLCLTVFSITTTHSNCMSSCSFTALSSFSFYLHIVALSRVLDHHTSQHIRASNSTRSLTSLSCLFFFLFSLSIYSTP